MSHLERACGGWFLKTTRLPDVVLSRQGEIV